VIGNILDTAAGFKQVYRNGMTQRVYVCCRKSRLVRVAAKEILHLAFLHCALPSGKQVWSNISAHSQIRTQKFYGVPPQWFLSADAILKTP
jgi:hypothetical protein